MARSKGRSKSKTSSVEALGVNRLEPEKNRPSRGWDVSLEADACITYNVKGVYSKRGARYIEWLDIRSQWRCRKVWL